MLFAKSYLKQRNASVVFNIATFWKLRFFSESLLFVVLGWKVNPVFYSISLLQIVTLSKSIEYLAIAFAKNFS
jgi:hypothetical protein